MTTIENNNIDIEAFPVSTTPQEPVQNNKSKCSSKGRCGKSGKCGSNAQKHGANHGQKPKQSKCGHNHGGEDKCGHGGKGGHSQGHSHGGHSHGHDDDGHGHDHEHGGNKKQQYKMFICTMIFLVWYNCLFVFNGPLESRISEKRGNQVIMTFLAVLAAISYYKACKTKSSNPTKDMPIYLNKEDTDFCKKCEFWKPKRVRHCRQCNECVLRMDHHCPYIGTCVGYRNHKSFVLFCTYIGTGCLYHTYRSIYYYYDSSSSNSTILFSLYWIIHSLMTFGIGCLVFHLAVFHIRLAAKNGTTIGGMKREGHDNSQAQPEDEKQFDQGILANLNEFFGKSILLFWYPTVPSDFYTGQHYQQIGYAKDIEMSSSVSNIELGQILETGEEFFNQINKIEEENTAVAVAVEETTKE